MRQRLFRVAVSVLLIVAVVASVDRKALVSAIASLDPLFLLPAVLLIWSTTFVSAFRWSIVIHSFGLSGTPLPSYWRLWSLFWIGQFFNQLLPSGLGGDGMRMWLLRNTGLPTGTAVTSVVVDRLIGLIAIVLLVAVTLSFAFDAAVGRQAPSWFWVVVAVGAVGFGILAGISAAQSPAVRSANSIVRGVRRLSADFRKLMLRPRYLAAALAASITVQMLGAAAVWVVAQSLGVRIGLLSCLALMPIVVLATAVPISVAGWGVREVSMIAVLATVGVAKESALVISVLYGGLAVATSLPAGILWLFGRRPVDDRLKTPSINVAE